MEIADRTNPDEKRDWYAASERRDGDCLLKPGVVSEAINDHDEYELSGASEQASQKTRQQINDALLAVGLKYRIVGNGTILKPEFMDVFSGI